MEPTKRCPYCAEEILAAAIKCKHCNSSLTKPILATADEIARVDQRGAPVITGRTSHDTRSQLSELPYAGFWRRLFGWVVDYFVCIFAIALIAVVLGPLTSSNDMQQLYVGIFYFVVPLLYSVIMESSRIQATVGKLVAGIKVTDLQGNRISVLRALGRFLSHILDGITLGIGYGMAAFTERRQALHDLVAGTLVVRRAFDRAAIDGAALAPTSGLRTVGVVVGVLLFGPFSVGVLAAIAIPAYQNYTIRSQVAEGLNAADPFKTVVAEAMSQNVSPSNLNSQNLGISQPGNLKYVQSIVVQSGSIIIEYGREANAKIRGNTIVIIPGLDANQDIVWVCGRASAPSNITMSFENGARFTTVADAYLPPICRAQ